MQALHHTFTCWEHRMHALHQKFTCWERWMHALRQTFADNNSTRYYRELHVPGQNLKFILYFDNVIMFDVEKINNDNLHSIKR